MICQQGKVRELDDGRARVSVASAGACQTCLEGRGCGMALFSGWFTNREIEIWVPAEPDLQPGSAVALRIDERVLLKLAVWVYGIPLLAFLCAAGSAHFLLQGRAAVMIDLGAAVAGLIALVLTLRYQGRRPFPVGVDCRLLGVSEP